MQHLLLFALWDKTLKVRFQICPSLATCITANEGLCLKSS
jgi:hypothetical protein